ncbi:MAG: T9SS C-terminal target domain-containing protein [Calditrichaeota bacterium]|nr:MAG: T9SS C-terminal target domain-containing protein [Calditrichota bacterium]
MKQFLKKFSKLGKALLVGAIFALPTSAFAQFSLTTTYAGGNGQGGNMFNIVAVNTVTITNFDVNITPGNWDMEVYVLTSGGAYAQADVTTAANWTLVGSATGVVSNGNGVPTPLPIPVNVTIPAGNTQGFYVTCSNGGQSNYTNGTTTGGVFVQDTNIQVLEGHGVVYPFGPNNWNPRNWNGTIHYTAGDAGLSAVESELQGATDSNVTYNLTASNFTTTADDYNISFSGNTWSVDAFIGGTPVLSTGSIAGGGSGNFDVEVTIPATANNGDTDTTIVTITSVANPNTTASATLVTTVVNYAVEVQTDLYGSGDAGTNLVYDVKVKNIGSLDDDFNIAFAGNSWTSQALVGGTPATNTGTILAGDSLTVQIETTAPIGAATNDFDGANVTFTSVGDAAVSDISVINSWAIDPNAPQSKFAEILQYEFNSTNSASAGDNIALPGFGSSTATVNGLALNQGGQGTGLTGNGATSDVEYLDTGWVTSLTGSWTISFWVDLTNSVDFGYLFGDDTADAFRCFTGGVAGVGGIILRNTTAGVNLNAFVIPAGALSAAPGVVTFVHDSENLKFKTYINNTFVSEEEAPAGFTVNGTNIFKIGSYSTLATIPVGAVMDNFKLYNRAIEPGLRLEQLLETDIHDQNYDLWVEASDFAPGIDPSTVSVHWKLSTDANYNTIPTSPSIGDLYTAQIPATNAFDVNIEYYASATDVDGNTSYFPYNPNTGQGTPYNFDVRLIQPGTLAADPIAPGVIPLSWKVGGDNSITMRYDDGSTEYQSILPNTPPGLNSPAAITFANYFDVSSTSINGNAQLTSVDFYVASGATSTSEVVVNVYENAGGVPGNIIASSLAMAQGNGGVWVNVDFVDPITGIGADVGNGAFFVGVEQTTNSQMSLGGDETLNAPYNFNVNTHFFQGAGNWTAIETVSLYGQVIPMIRCNVDEIPVVVAPTSLQNAEIFTTKKSVKSPFSAQRKMEAKGKRIAVSRSNVEANEVVSNKGGNQVLTTPTWTVSEYRLYRFDGVANSASDVVANGTMIYNGANLNFDDNNVVDMQNYSYAVSTVYDVNATNLESDPSNLVIASPFIVGIEDEENVVIPLEYSVSQNYPNPFNPTTKIDYTLKVDESVKLVVYNSLGQEVKTLVNESQKAGVQYTAVWDGTDRNGKVVSSGVYYYKLKTNSGFEVKKKATFLK